MKIFVQVIIAIFFLSCSPLKKTVQGDCVENKEFKNSFFSSIEKVEFYVVGKGDKKSFQESLKFISKYVHVSFDKMLNYNNSYTNYKDFENDKTEWLKWYESNKCNDVKVKK